MLEHESNPMVRGADFQSGNMPFKPANALPRIQSGHLLQGGRDLVIEHAGQEYRLRLTRNDKLILTK